MLDVVSGVVICGALTEGRLNLHAEVWPQGKISHLARDHTTSHLNAQILRNQGRRVVTFREPKSCHSGTPLKSSQNVSWEVIP